MKIINDNKMNLNLLKKGITKPEIFEKSTDKFWDDEYVSEQMLKLHLNPDIEAASKTIDFSDRSIDYANNTIKPEYRNTLFNKANYLDLNYEEFFDIVTLIFYDFCALNTNEQNMLLSKIHTALKINGLFLFDIVTENKKVSISTNISVCEEGFWSPKPYAEILNTYLYDNPKTEGLQYTIIDGEGFSRIIRIYHRLFSLNEITEMLNENGFKVEKVYSNLKGDAFSEDSETYGIIARKA